MRFVRKSVPILSFPPFIVLKLPAVDGRFMGFARNLKRQIF